MHANRKKKSKKTKANCTENTAQPDNEEPESEESLVERFERELTWCVEQLQLGLETQNPDSRQATEAVKVLKILTSSKAPMVKKRLAMRNAFGDYRKKIREQEKKSAAAARKMRLLPVEDKGYEKSQFFRKSTKRTASGHLKHTTELTLTEPTPTKPTRTEPTPAESTPTEPTPANNLQHFSDTATDAVPETDSKGTAGELEITEVELDKAKVVDNAEARTDELNASFKFSFKLEDDVDTAAAGGIGELGGTGDAIMADTDQTAAGGIGELGGTGDAIMAHTSQTAEEQAFRFSKSDNTFRFGFTVGDEKS